VKKFVTSRDSGVHYVFPSPAKSTQYHSSRRLANDSLYSPGIIFCCSAARQAEPNIPAWCRSPQLTNFQHELYTIFARVVRLHYLFCNLTSWNCHLWFEDTCTWRGTIMKLWERQCISQLYNKKWHENNDVPVHRHRMPQTGWRQKG
jgi:hypothetical protein